MKEIIIFCLFVATSFSVHAQVETKYYSSPHRSTEYYRVRDLANNTPVITMPSFDVVALQKEDSITADLDIPYRFGKDFLISYSLDDGKWYHLDNGRVWALTFESVGAYSLNFIFDNFFLPIGASLEIINEDGTAFYGPVTADAIPKNGHFMTDLISGSKCTIYLFEPADVIGESSLTISSVIHAYRGLNIHSFNKNGLGSSSSCNVDVSCYPEYEQESKAVALVLLANGTEWCSGSLLMSTDMSFKPYLLTAFHCIDSNYNGSLSSAEKEAAENWMFKFNFKKEECNGTTLHASTTYNGAIFRAGWNNSDFGLMEISHDLKTNPSLYWLGWDRSGDNPSHGVCIHHPCGDVMKVSFEDDDFVSSSWNNGGATNHWRVSYDEGVTEGGSSGSPILDQNLRVVGQLHGGEEVPPSCIGMTDWFGQFNISWSGDGSNDTRLSNWLDSIGTNQITIDGRTSQSIIGPTIPESASVYYVNNLSNDYNVSWAWKYGSSVQITQNSPATNQCTISNNSKSYINDILVAAVQKNGATLAVFEKLINTGLNFQGTYEQAAYVYGDWNYGGTSPSIFISPDTIRLYKQATITLRSDHFVGATISCSGSTPLDWTFNDSIISFHFKYLAPYNPGLPIHTLQPIGSTTSQLLITGQYANSYETFQFLVEGYDPDILLPLYNTPNMSIELIGSILNITLNSVESSFVDGIEQNSQDSEYFRLLITNAITGKVLYDSEPQDKTIRLNTSEWDDGIYLIQASFKGRETICQKISIKRH